MRAAVATMRSAMAEAAANRVSLTSKMTVMIVNDVVWIMFWVLFFRGVGDIQGCDAPLARLVEKIGFSPSRDTLYLLGDLVNRGPASAAVLRRLMGYGDAARCLLGNHDLSLLAVAHGHRAPHRNDTMDDILRAPDREAMLDWLRHRSLALQAHGILMVHGGVLPAWDAAQALALAGEVETVLRGPGLPDFLARMWGNQPDQWDDALAGADRLRVIIAVAQAGHL